MPIQLMMEIEDYKKRVMAVAVAVVAQQAALLANIFLATIEKVIQSVLHVFHHVLLAHLQPHVKVVLQATPGTALTAFKMKLTQTLQIRIGLNFIRFQLEINHLADLAGPSQLLD